MKADKEIFDFKSKSKGMPIRQLATGAILVFATLVNILVDYVMVRFDPGIYADPTYWLNLVTTNAAVVAILFSVRGYMRERELSTNADIQDTQAQIDAAHAELSRRNLATKFEDYVNAENGARKLKAYRLSLQRKLTKCGRERKRRRLLALLDRADDEVDCLKVRYNKIRISTIFSKTKLKHNDDEDLDDGEEQQIGRLLMNKVVCILAFGVLGSSLAFGPKTFVTAFLISTCIKLFQTAYAIYVGGSDGQSFAKGTMLSKMRLRLDFVQKFIEKEKAVCMLPAKPY